MTSNDNQCANDGIPSRDVRIVAVIMNMSERGERETRLKLIRELVESELLPLNAVQSVADITDNKITRIIRKIRKSFLAVHRDRNGMALFFKKNLQEITHTALIIYHQDGKH